MKNTLSILFLLSLFSCETLVNDVDPSKLGINQATIVINAYLCPDDSIITAKIHRTLSLFSTRELPLNGGFFQNQQDSIVTDAKVEITSKTQKIVLIFNAKEKIYIAPRADFKLNPKESYTLKVIDKNGEIYTANTVLPEPINITIGNIAEKPSGFQSQTGYNNKIIEISFEMSLKPNSYAYGQNEFSYLFINPITKTKTLQGYRNVIDLENIKNESLIETKEKIKSTFSLSYDKNTSTDLKTSVIIYNFDKNLYLYNNSVRKSDYGNNPFVEPTLINSNIKGALGCFGSYNKTEKILPIKY